MRAWLLWSVLFVLAVVVAVAPWRRPDPRHELMFTLVQSLPPDEVAAGPENGQPTTEDAYVVGSSAGRTDDPGRADF